MVVHAFLFLLHPFAHHLLLEVSLRHCVNLRLLLEELHQLNALLVRLYRLIESGEGHVEDIVVWVWAERVFAGRHVWLRVVQLRLELLAADLVVDHGVELIVEHEVNVALDGAYDILQLLVA